MRFIPWLCCLVTHAWTVTANVEKTIFLGPSPVTISNVHPNLDDLYLDSLSPLHTSALGKQLSVQFPTGAAPRGAESWYILQGLTSGQRYEVRICWPATSPTDFWLDAYPLTDVFDTSELSQSLALYSERRQDSKPGTVAHAYSDIPPSAQSILFLRVQAAAAFYTKNHTLMEHPLPVDVDIILDPFILNILPRSLIPVGIYIIILAVGAWFLSAYLYRWLLSIATEAPSKPHTD
ncbi:hypothetical protein BU24DRAFT_205979 [Aaosphaeria arxii CBS 175.79]|uniref:Protein PBN1 n=1 Tax=Aaosphaeria arxii CBS 175.79 TaxID=1450172 RepID=A0A6A5XUI1_9PLEO|nr:uncharacterized protein BU24DRAFT_205979 [Aaosphaeria arxii CBS 175.79]KAF2016589.1 hypothetical protein BU24DRAFT_205979 [Aaosphaeria arxii CBS 175.79]